MIDLPTMPSNITDKRILSIYGLDKSFNIEDTISFIHRTFGINRAINHFNRKGNKESAILDTEKNVPNILLDILNTYAQYGHHVTSFVAVTESLNNAHHHFSTLIMD